jgi:hypothetical protein
MLGTDRAELRIEDGGVADTKPVCVALVPVNPSAETARFSTFRSSRPSAIFVAHLIATAAQAPQTCRLRRASLADAQTAYSVSRRAPQTAGFRNRHTI